MTQAYPAPHSPPPPTSRSGVGLFQLIWAVIFLVLILALPTLVEHIQYAITRGKQRAEHDVAAGQLAALPDEVSVNRAVAKKIAPSVVGIVATQRTQRVAADELSDLFGGNGRQQFQTESQGSGVIVDAEGYVLTNAHVIENAQNVVVQLSDGRSIKNVQLVGDDPLTDLAVLRIEAGDLIAAPWGDSDKLEVGDPVLAVGNPFGLARTVTAGIVSAKERRGLLANTVYQDFLQTDAAVNPGNSGGPLVNLRAEVVGINTAIVGRAYQGISFAIPSNIAKDVYDRLRAAGRVTRGWLGVEPQPLNERLARRLGLKDTTGALVASVVSGGPAEKAGIEVGDVIVQWNGKAIREPQDLILQVARTEVGSKADVVILRNGERSTVTVVVGQRPAPTGRR